MTPICRIPFYGKPDYSKRIAFYTGSLVVYRLRKPLLERINANRRITTWLDAQHQYTAIAQRADERPALHAVAVIAAMAATVLTRTRPTLRHGAVSAAGPVAAQGRAGREQVRP